MIVPLYSVNGWTCDYQPRKGHVLTKGRDRILIRERGARMTVQRTWFDRVFDRHPEPYGNVYNGGEQGGGGIDLHPKYDRAKLDGTIERHAIGWWNADGTPHMPGTRYPLQSFEPTSPYAKLDGPHYVRAFGPGVGSRDPVAIWWLQTCAYDVMRRFPLQPFTDGDGPEYSLHSMWINVNASPHQGGLGICRELAWSLRCVVEAQRVAPCEEFRWRIIRMIDTIYMGQALNGACESHTYGQGLAQEETEARSFGIPEGQSWAVRWQAPFLIRAVREAMDVVPSTHAHGRTILERFKPWYEPSFPKGKYLVMNEGPITRGYGPGIPTYDEDAVMAIRSVGL